MDQYVPVHINSFVVRAGIAMVSSSERRKWATSHTFTFGAGIVIASNSYMGGVGN